MEQRNYIFENAPLKAVILEARKNNCPIVISNAEGFFMASKSCEMRDGKPVHIAYARGCNFHTDVDWYLEVSDLYEYGDFITETDSADDLFDDIINYPENLLAIRNEAEGDEELNLAMVILLPRK